ncbi:unnamed protein product [Musa acuminata subsp. burmannicoides]
MRDDGVLFVPYHRRTTIAAGIVERKAVLKQHAGNELLWLLLSHPPGLRPPPPRRRRRGHPQIAELQNISPKSPDLSPSVPARRSRPLLPNRFGLRMAKESKSARIGGASRSHIEVAGLVVDKDDTCRTRCVAKMGCWRR